jgi:hypothetical protein
VPQGNDWNNWETSYTHIQFLKRVLSGHQQVESFQRRKDIVFYIERREQLPSVVAVLINRYTIGLADVLSVLAEFPEATCIVAPGDWCGYTREAKEYGIAHGIGVFNTSEFFGALWRTDPKSYVKKDNDGKPIYAYHAAA